MQTPVSRQRLYPRLFGGGKMNDLEWNDEYSLGIPEIDIQHKRIFDCYKTMAEEGLAKQDRWLADSSIDQLRSLIQAHFAIEETVMRILGYPELERHIEEHRQLHADVHDLAQTSLRTKGSVSREMIHISKKRLREHIMTSDRHYADYFSGLVQKSVGKKLGAR
jgi:hemerythrin